jgi:hypothetical protein
MQPQGLEALMPQGAAGPQPQAPQMGGPRLAAAMDLVTSDAEEQVIDPRTLAMLKYKDALDAMQAADRMMAAAQPQPMPPTVAERTKMAAEQGIAGLASRLSPGIQQRGNQLAAQELRQAMGGGLPQLPAPNMARMAGGGIVAFQDGGGVGGSFSRREPRVLEAIADYFRSQAQATGTTPEDIQRMYSTSPEAVEAILQTAATAKGRPENIEVVGPQQTPVLAETEVGQGVEQQPGGLAALVEQMRAQGDAPVGRPASDTAGADDLESLRESTSFIRDLTLRPDFVESSGRNVEERAREAYGVPEELKELYRSRIEALDKPMFTPEEERSRKISAILSGLASSNLIAQGGPAASRAVAEVSDAIRADSVARAEKQFDLASGLLGMDMQASQRAFNAGLEATITAMNQQGVALQMAISQLTAAADREAAALLQESRNGIEMTKQMIEAFKNGQSNAIDVQRNVGAMVRDLGDRIDKLKTSGLPGQPLSPEVNTAIRVLENERSALQSVFNAALGESGFAVPEISGGVGLTPDDEELIKRYTR